MANLTNYQYFYGEIKITNLTKTENRNDLEVDITVFEREIMLDLFGYPLYTAYSAGIAATTPLQKWIDLRDGKVFSFDVNGKTVTRRWNGLINSIKLSLLSFYTYYKVKERLVSQTAEVGETYPKGQNSTPANAAPKMANAWLRMRELYGITPYGFDKLNSSHYVHYNALPTAYNFLLANESSYDDWEFEPKNSVNVFDF